MRIAVYKKGHVYSHYPHMTRSYPYTYTHVGHVPSHTYGMRIQKKYPQNLFMSKVFRIFIVYLIRHHERRTKTESI